MNAFILSFYLQPEDSAGLACSLRVEAFLKPSKASLSGISLFVGFAVALLGISTSSLGVIHSIPYCMIPGYSFHRFIFCRFGELSLLFLYLRLDG